MGVSGDSQLSAASGQLRAPAIASPDGIKFDASCDVLIIGAGSAGLVAALRAKAKGADVVVLERDIMPSGSTALSAGLIPAATTRFQAAAGIVDSHELFCADIMAKAHDKKAHDKKAHDKKAHDKKAHGEPEFAAVEAVVMAISQAIEWLADEHGFPFSLIENFAYPGHSALRMHGLPSRSGAELMNRLRSAAETKGIDIVTSAMVDMLYADGDGRVHGVSITRPDGTVENMGCHELVLACNGYGGHAGLVSELIPEMQGALYFGHPGNQGDALRWGQALGAATRHLPGYQGHGSVAHPHGVLISWATITEGGFQINAGGQRFANEALGYSEAAALVLAQKDATAWTIFDSRIANIARQFEDFRNAEAMGAIITARTIQELAALIKVDAARLNATFDQVEQLKIISSSNAHPSASHDMWGRSWAGSKPLSPPFCAVRVTGALFHTQGGLVVDGSARVMNEAGQALPNLLAAGGAAAGVSGNAASGYLSGNGLLTAIAYGYLAGDSAGQAILRAKSMP